MGVVGPGTADRRAGVRRLDKAGKAEACGHPRAGRLPVLFCADQLPAGHRHSDPFSDDVGVDLIEGQRRRGHPAAHIGQVGKLQQSLDCAVLTVLAVHHRKNHIHRDDPSLPGDKHPSGRTVRGKDCRHGVLLPAVGGNRSRVLSAAEQPASVAGHPKEQRIKAFTVEIFDHRGRRAQRDLVFVGNPAE